MKRLIIGSMLVAAAISAQEIKKRQEKQQDRIANGVASGELTPKEAAKVESKEAKLDKTIAKDRASGGGLSAKERRQINRKQNRASKDIYKQKHDAQKQ